MIELAFADELRFIALQYLYEWDGDKSIGIEKAANHIKHLKPNVTSEEARRSAEKAYDLNRMERNIGIIYRDQIRRHSEIIGKEYSRVRELSEELIKFVPNSENQPKFIQLKNELWEKIHNMISHGGSAYNVFAPQINEKMEPQLKEKRLHRQKIVRNYAGINENLLRPLKDIRNAQTHFDEYMDDYIWDLIQNGGTIQDYALIGCDHLPLHRSDVTIIRSYDLKNDRLYYKAKDKTIRLAAILEFLSGVNQCYWHNTTFPVPYLQAPMSFAMKDGWSIH